VYSHSYQLTETIAVKFGRVPNANIVDEIDINDPRLSEWVQGVTVV